MCSSRGTTQGTFLKSQSSCNRPKDKHFDLFEGQICRTANGQYIHNIPDEDKSRFVALVDIDEKCDASGEIFLCQVFLVWKDNFGVEK